MHFPTELLPSTRDRSLLFIDQRAKDRRAHFTILLPERMRCVGRPVVLPDEEYSPVSVALFRTKEEPRVEVEIVGLFLRREIAPADVLRTLLEGSTLLAERTVPSAGGDLLDALTRHEAPEPYVSRWWTVKDGGAGGGRLYCVQARVAEAHYRQVADELYAAASTFRLLNPTPWDFFEELCSLSRRTPNDFLLFHPLSWQLQVASEPGPERPFVAHLWQRLGGTIAGRISVLSVESLDPAALFEVYERSIRQHAADIAWEALTPAPAFARGERAFRTRGQARPRDGSPPVDLCVSIVTRGRGAMLLGLASIQPSVDPLAAAMNERALHIVEQTLRIA